MVRSISCRRGQSPGGIFVHAKCVTSAIVLGLAIRHNCLAPDNTHVHIIILKVIMWISKIFVRLRCKLTSIFKKYFKPILKLSQGWKLNFWWAKLILPVCYRWSWRHDLRRILWYIDILCLKYQQTESNSLFTWSPRFHLVIWIKYHSVYTQ